MAFRTPNLRDRALLLFGSLVWAVPEGCVWALVLVVVTLRAGGLVQFLTWTEGGFAEDSEEEFGWLDVDMGFRACWLFDWREGRTVGWLDEIGRLA
jgi:hypothetical protein